MVHTAADIDELLARADCQDDPDPMADELFQALRSSQRQLDHAWEIAHRRRELMDLIADERNTQCGERDFLTRVIAMTIDTWTSIRAELDAAEAASAEADSLGALPHLRRARKGMDDLINDHLAKAVVTGSTLRAAASAASFTENAIRPRLGSSEILAPYADDTGSVSAEAVTRARRDYLVDPDKRPPLSFVARRPTTHENGEH